NFSEKQLATLEMLSSSCLAAQIPHFMSAKHFAGFPSTEGNSKCEVTSNLCCGFVNSGRPVMNALRAITPTNVDASRRGAPVADAIQLRALQEQLERSIDGEVRFDDGSKAIY